MKKKVKVRIVPCEIFSRVVGYYRPTSNWNAGKLEEFENRVLFDPKNININDNEVKNEKV